MAPPQFGHSVVWVFAIASWDRRRRVRPGDWRKAGTGIGVIRCEKVSEPAEPAKVVCKDQNRVK